MGSKGLPGMRWTLGLHLLEVASLRVVVLHEEEHADDGERADDEADPETEEQPASSLLGASRLQRVPSRRHHVRAGGVAARMGL